MGLRAFAPFPPRVARRRRTTLGSGTKPRWGLDAAATDDCGTEYVKTADRKSMEFSAILHSPGRG